MSRRLLALLLAMCLFMVVACSSSDGSDGGRADNTDGTTATVPNGLGGPTTDTPLGPATPTGTPGGQKFLVNLLARDVAAKFAKELIRGYMASHPGSLVKLTVDNGDGIASRIAAGEQPDIILANRKQLNALADEDVLAWRPQEFGTQVLVIVVDKGNPKGINSLKVFDDDPNVSTGLCSLTKNCGRSANNILIRAGIGYKADRILNTATDVVNQVRDGVIDASILDSTKAANRGPVVDGVRVPNSLKPVTTHWQMSSVTGSTAADSFTTYMFSSAGAAVLNERGLLPIVP